MKMIIKFSSTILLVVAILLLISSPVTAAVSGFVAKGDDGNFYEYSYDNLLDSYALSILGSPDGYYEDFAGKKSYAILISNGKYIEYNDILDRYASALVKGEAFNLGEHAEKEKIKLAALPSEIKVVIFNSGRIVYELKKIASGGVEEEPGYRPRRTKTPLVGSAEVSVEQAQKWAKSREAHRRFIDIAPLYWEFAEKSGLRPEVLYAQSAMETKFGEYDGTVPPEYNNWAGLKIAEENGDSRENHEVFSTPEEGVRAHFNHLSAYVGLKPIGEPHGRYHLVAEQPWAGSVFYVEDLSGKWTPSEDYHIYILIALDQIFDTELEKEIPGPDDNDDQNKNEPESETKPKTGSNNPDKRHVAVDVSVLHFRGGPSTDDEILERLTLGTVLKVTANQSEWLKVITPEGKNGWVHGDYVREVDMDLPENPLKGKIIVIDPGHGGSDPGATGVTGLREKVVNLSVAKELIPLLELAGADVVTTRSGDHTVSNRARVEIANKAKADLYLSIHANAYSNPDSNGTETYYWSKGENAHASRFLAHQLQREVTSVLGLRDRGVKSSNFYVLTNTIMSAVLVEIGFLTNPEEEELLSKPVTHRETAEAMYEGLKAYFLYYR